MYKIALHVIISGGPSAPTARVVLLTNIPSSDSMAEVHPAMVSTTVTNLGQVELDLEITNSGNKSDKGTTSKGAASATGNGTRKKSSSALQAEEEEGGSGKKTSKSSDDSEREHVRVSELRDAQAQSAQTANCGLINIGPEEASLLTTEATAQPQEALACKDNTGNKQQR